MNYDSLDVNLIKIEIFSNNFFYLMIDQKKLFENISIPPTVGEYGYYDSRFYQDFQKVGNYSYQIKVFGEDKVKYASFSSKTNLASTNYITSKGLITTVENLFPDSIPISIPPKIGEYGYYNPKIVNEFLINKSKICSFSSPVNTTFKLNFTNHGIVEQIDNIKD